MSNITKQSKTATEILFEHGIEMTNNDTFNCQLLHAMERYAESKVSLQNKVSDVSAEEKELRASFEKILPMGMPSLLEKCVKTSQEYASIVNENKDIDEECLKITGHNSPKEYAAYEKGREDEQEVIMKWIEKWDGSSNSVIGALLKKKLNERKDNVESDAAEFANWIINNRYIFDFKKIKYVAAWNNYQELTTEELYKIFQESQPQQKEEPERCTQCNKILKGVEIKKGICDECDI